MPKGRRSLPAAIVKFIERRPGAAATREQIFDAMPATLDQIRSAIAGAILNGWIEAVGGQPANRIPGNQLYRRTSRSLTESRQRQTLGPRVGHAPTADDMARCDRRWRQQAGDARFEDHPASLRRPMAFARVSGPGYAGSVTGSAAAMCAGQ